VANKSILQWPDKTLRKTSASVEKFDENLSVLIQDLVDTLEVNYGAGLAAAQIGILERVLIIKPSSFGVNNPMPDQEHPDVWVVVNPTIGLSGPDVRGQEACLSVPYKGAHVTRSSRARVDYFDRHGSPVSLEVEAPLSVVLQHEADHLDGKLYFDRVTSFTRGTIKKKILKRIVARKRAAKMAEEQLELELYGKKSPSSSAHKKKKKKRVKKKFGINKRKKK
jgi:peptide deformylase